MSLNFPNKLTLRFVDSKTNEPISGLVVLLTLFAREKNDYDIGPNLSDHNGQVVFERSQAFHEIDLLQKAFLMDYKSKLEECGSLVQVETMPPEAIEKLIQARKYYSAAMPEFALTEDQIVAFRSKINADYFPFKQRIDPVERSAGDFWKFSVLSRTSNHP